MVSLTIAVALRCFVNASLHCGGNLCVKEHS